MLPRPRWLATFRRGWRAAAAIVLVTVASAWLSLALTPPASVSLGIVDAQISASPGSGTVVRTTMGRPVTDDTVNRGPLQVQVAIAVDRTHPRTEPEVLSALRDARPRVVHAAVDRKSVV